MSHFHLVQRQAFQNGQSHKSLDQDYLSCLKSFWQGQYANTIDKIGNLLSQQLDHRHKFALYRLWLECLWVNNDQHGLRALQDHFRNLSREWEEERDFFTAFQALSSLALDEWEQVQCWKQSSGPESSLSYWQEFNLLLQINLGEEIDAEKIFLKVRSPILDYCQWLSVVKALYKAKSHRYLAQTLDYVVRVFDLAPLRSLFYALVNIDAGNFRQANAEIHEAIQNFPNNPDFKVFQAYALAKDGKFKDALQSLDRSQAPIKNDVDALAVRAFALDELDKTPGEEGHFRSDAIRAYEQLLDQLSHQNLNPVYAKQQLDAFEDTQHSINDKSGSWFLGLQLRDYNQLLTASEDDPAFSCTVSKEVKRGDICFVGFRSQQDERGRDHAELKIAAVCLVDSTPARDPLAGHRARLRIIFKPDAVMRRELIIGKNDTQSKMQSQNECWRLTEKAFDDIFEPLVEEYQEQFKRLCDNLSELGTPVAGYLNNVINTVRRTS